jgi:hypothetical protein
MRARLKSLTSEEVPDLEHYLPPAIDDFAVPLVLEVGPLGVRGKERFELLVVTPKWLLARHGTKGQVVGRGKLIVFEWSFERIKAYLAKEVEACEAESWPDVAKKVGRIAEWEGDGSEVLALI